MNYFMRLFKISKWKLWEGETLNSVHLLNMLKALYPRLCRNNKGIKILDLIPTAWCGMLSPVRLCESMDSKLPGPSVHGILQARILEWVARSRDWTCVSCISNQVLYHCATWESHDSYCYKLECLWCGSGGVSCSVMSGCVQSHGL